jgi:cysteine desulfurase
MMNLMNWFNNIFSPAKLGTGKNSKRIFLDYASATPVLKEVRDEMEKYFSRSFHNPSSIYEEGLEVKEEMESYRAGVARVLGAGGKEVVFTSGGTESNNLAILGVFEEAKKTVEGPHIIISAIEHSAVVRAAEECVRRGGELSVVEVDEEGVVAVGALEKLIRKNTVLISVTLANSEIGTIEPIAKIGRIVREMRRQNHSSYPVLHTDASAAPCYLNVNIEGLQADLITLDGAKIYGPKGVGVLAPRRGVKLHPVIFGGGQERGLRAGTTNSALIAGFSKALMIAEHDREGETKRLSSLRREFVESVIKNLPHAVINGSSENHLPNIVSVSIPNILAEFALLKLDREGVAVSVGTTCSLDEKERGSPIIKALGKDELKEATLRISFGKFTTIDEVKKASEIFCRTLQNMLK